MWSGLNQAQDNHALYCAHDLTLIGHVTIWKHSLLRRNIFTFSFLDIIYLIFICVHVFCLSQTYSLFYTPQFFPITLRLLDFCLRLCFSVSLCSPSLFLSINKHRVHLVVFSMHIGTGSSTGV